MKKLLAIGLLLLAACQAPSETSAPTNIISAPASDDAQALDYTKLPEGFPVIGEIELPITPKRCGLSKANRFDAVDGEAYDNRYVFTSIGGTASGDEQLYQLGISGVLRTVKQSGMADMDDKKVRYFKTVTAPEVEIMVVVEQDGNRDKSIVGRVKAWDAGVPLLCGYNRIEVVGDCDL